MKSMTWAIAILASAVALQACTKQGVDPAKVQADVAKAQAEGQEKVAAAQAKFDRLKNELNSAATPTPTTGTPPSGVDAPGTTAIAVDPAQRLVELVERPLLVLDQPQRELLVIVLGADVRHVQRHIR